MKVTNSFEAVVVCDTLRKELRNINYNPDLQKMLNNIEKMVTNLSRAEVDFRRTKNKSILNTPIEQLNQSIEHLEKLMLIAKIMD